MTWHSYFVAAAIFVGIDVAAAFAYATAEYVRDLARAVMGRGEFP